MQRFENIYSAKRERHTKLEMGGGRREQEKKLFLKFPLTTNSSKLNTHHKQIKKAEWVRAEGIKQINKMSDFSSPWS